MNILFDTHTFLWFIEGDDALSSRARNEIKTIRNAVFLSTVSYWEICLKISIGKLRLSELWQKTIELSLSENGIKWMDIKKEHLNGIVDLPWHHRDPFDRLLIAQAIAEECVLCSADKDISSYAIEILA